MENIPKALDERRNKEAETEIKEVLSGVTSFPVDVIFLGAAMEGKEMTTGSVKTDEDESGLQYVIDDRQVQIKLDRNDSSCEWAYDNEVAVFNNIQRLVNTFNNGIVEKMNTEKYKDKDQLKKAEEYLKKKRKDLALAVNLNAWLTNRELYGFGILSKALKGEKEEIVGLLPINCHEDRCKPIFNLQTGDLGGSAGLNVDPDRADVEIALVQKGQIAKYSNEGEVSYENKNFYFKRNQIMPLTTGDRGRFKGTSRVKRILRLVELKKTIENAVDLMIKRFGPQIWVIVGNKDYNIGNTKTPTKFMRDASGNPVDESIAKAAYRDEIFEDVNKKIQKWAKGETLVQVAEYGLDVKALTPNQNLWQYSRYIDLYADYIKVGIFGLDVAGRVDVTSALMQDRIFRDLKDRARREREQIMYVMRTELSEQLLKVKNFPEDIGWWEFKPLDKVDDEQDAKMELKRSETIRNFKLAGIKVPKYLMEKWNLEPNVNKSTNQIIEQRSPGSKSQANEYETRQGRQRTNPTNINDVR